MAGSKKPIIRLLSVASSSGDILQPLGCDSAADLIHLVQETVGQAYRVTANRPQLETPECDEKAGRRDDLARAHEISRTLADERIVAAICLRGGAWLTRILPQVDFTRARARRTRVALFGFSENTTLINLAARSPRVWAYYDLCPGFLRTALELDARSCGKPPANRPQPHQHAVAEMADERRADDRFRHRFIAFFHDVIDILEGRGSSRSISATLACGRLADRAPIRVVGGNLCTLITLLPSPGARALHPPGRWLAVEDIREPPDRIDRMLAHLTLKGWLNRYEGFLVGRFDRHNRNIADQAVACLRRQLADPDTPILVTPNVGHALSIAPLPINRTFIMQRRGRAGRFDAQIPWSDWRVVDSARSRPASPE